MNQEDVNLTKLADGSMLNGNMYRIVRAIGNGGFGNTYEALHVNMNKRVAVKELFVKDFCNREGNTGSVYVATESRRPLVEKLKRKFIEEARALGQIKHVGIVNVHDVFEQNGTAYYVMDYIDGCSLEDMVSKQGAFTEQQALGYILQIADALEYVHGRNRLHLDIKPNNIMVNADGQAILIDFGTSKQYDEANGENNSTIMGQTPGYAPPEQASNDVKKFSPATDIYALGATLYHLLTGNTPPAASLLASDEELQPLPSHISASTRKAVEKAMELKKKNRPQTIAEFRELIDSSAGQRTVGVQASPALVEPLSETRIVERGRKGKGTSMFLILLMAFVVLSAVAMGVFVFGGNSSSGEGSESSALSEVAEETPAAPMVETVSDLSYTNSKGVNFTYTGSTTDGVPQGQGFGVYTDGTYEGFYVDGLRSDENGKFTLLSGDITYSGKFVDDVIVEGRLTWPDRTYFEGTFQNEVPYNGSVYTEDGVFFGTYKNGIPLDDDGEVIV